MTQPLEINGHQDDAPSPPLLSREGVANLQIYYTPRRFTQDSKLHEFLATNCPDLVTQDNLNYNLFQVLTALKRVIATKQLYDPQNPTVVVCDHDLEEALDVKALHVSEIREQVCKQFVPVTPSVPGQEAPPVHPSPQPTGPIILPSCREGALILPAWAQRSANAVVARNHTNNAAPFNIEGSYKVKPAFLKVLRTVDGVDQTQTIFPYREVANLLSKYIMKNKEKFFDLRNIRVALVEGDLLGKAFGVKVFARSQVTALMRAQLSPVDGPDPEPETDGDGNQDSSEPMDTGGVTNDDDDGDAYRRAFEIDSSSDASDLDSSNDDSDVYLRYNGPVDKLLIEKEVDADSEWDQEDEEKQPSRWAPIVKTCIKCKNQINNALRFCTSCWIFKKSTTAFRSGKMRRKTRTKQVSSDHDGSNSHLNESADLCVVCCIRTKDSCFIHGQTSHQVCCYPCAKKIFNDRRNCPVCRRRVEKITHNFIH